jgi:hypothetical protein
MSIDWLANDNVPTKALRPRGVVVDLPGLSWKGGNAAFEIVCLRAASDRCRTAARAMTHPELKRRLATRALEIAFEAEALSRSSSRGPARAPTEPESH